MIKTTSQHKISVHVHCHFLESSTSGVFPSAADDAMFLHLFPCLFPPVDVVEGLLNLYFDVLARHFDFPVKAVEAGPRNAIVNASKFHFIRQIVK